MKYGIASNDESLTSSLQKLTASLNKMTLILFVFKQNQFIGVQTVFFRQLLSISLKRVDKTNLSQILKTFLARISE